MSGLERERETSGLDDWRYTVEPVRREDVAKMLALLALLVEEDASFSPQPSSSP